MNFSCLTEPAGKCVFDLRGSLGAPRTLPGWVSDPVRWALLCVMMVSLSACGSRTGEGTEQLLKERVAAYYEAYKAKDMLTVYQMESGSLPGGGLKPQEMQKRMGARIADYTLQGVNIKGNEGEAALSIGYLYGRLQRDPIYREVKDRWIFIDGVWYHETVKSGSFRGLGQASTRQREAGDAWRSSDSATQVPEGSEEAESGGGPPARPEVDESGE